MFTLLLTLLAPIEPPRYQFEPGLELTYRTLPPPTSEDKTKSPVSAERIQATVLAKNSDGTFRVMILTRTGNAPQFHYNLQMIQLASDGRIGNADKENTGFSTTLFPLLPQPGKDVWTRYHELDLVTSTFRPLTGPQAEAKPGQLLLREERRGGMLCIYDGESRFDYVFDLQQGLVTEIKRERLKNESPDHVPYKYAGSSTTSTFQLESKKILPAEELASLVKQVELYLQLQEGQSHHFTEAAKANIEEATRLMTENEKAWKEALPTFTHAGLKAMAENTTKNASNFIRHVQDDAKRRAEILGKEPPAWQARDFEGREYSSEKLRGKVVVLDFWYRGCGWCIRAMPQMNQLAGDFQNEPVVILGVNIDEDPADARFVIRQMKLAYPSLEFGKASSGDKPHPLLTCTFGYPTLLVIDRQGKLADIHVGYSPTLREEVTKSIRQALAK